MIAWLFLLVLLVVEVAGLVRWLRKEYYPFFFNANAALIYSAVLAGDFILTWLLSFLFTPGGTNGTALLALLGSILFVLVALASAFLRWVVKSDMKDVP